MMSGMTLHRGYRIHNASKKATYNRVVYLLKHANFHCPIRFLWHDAGNMVELHKYIDSLVFRDTLTSSKYEEKGIATDHEYRDYNGEAPLITLSPHRLIAILRGEDVLEVPADATIRLHSSSEKGVSRFLPNEFMAALADSGLDAFQDWATMLRVQEGRPVRVEGGMENLPRTRKDKNQWFHLTSHDDYGHSGAMLEAAEHLMPSGGDAVARPPEAPKERLIRAKKTDTGVDTISVIEQEGSPPYFCRRIISVQGTTLYSATSWSIIGPWTSHLHDRIGLELAGFHVQEVSHEGA